MSDSVIKIYVEGGLEATIHGLGTEVSLYFTYIEWFSFFFPVKPVNVLLRACSFNFTVYYAIPILL